MAVGLEQHNDRLGSEYLFLNNYVNFNSPVVKTIQLYPADCILYAHFKETVALYAYFSTSMYIKSCNTKVWMTFFSQYNRLFFLLILIVLAVMNLKFFPSCLLTSRASKCLENWENLDIKFHFCLSPGLSCCFYFAFLVQDFITLKEQLIFYFVKKYKHLGAFSEIFQAKISLAKQVVGF